MATQDDRMIKITSYGDGPRHVVGFHGWGSEHRRSFKDPLKFLPEDVTFHGVDMPGCGESDKPESFDFERIHDDVARALDAVAPGHRLSLVGACSGSYHALPFAKRRPERVERIVLLEPFAYMPWFFSIFLAPVTGRALYKLVFDNPVGSAATAATLKRQNVSEDFDMVAAFKRTDKKVNYEYLKYYGSISDHKVFSDIQHPVRLVVGQNSWKAIHESVELWRELWPEQEVRRLEDVGHMFNQESPRRAARAIFDDELIPGRTLSIPS